MKKWIYHQYRLECREGSALLNHDFEEEQFNELGSKGWEIYQVDREKLENDDNIHNYALTIYCKREK